MSFDPVKIITVDLASGATLTSNPADVGHGYSKIYLEVPTMASGSLYIQGSTSRAGTYRRITQEVVNSSSVQTYDFSINSATTQRMVPIPPGFQFYKVENTSGVTDTTTTFKFICSTGG